MKEKFKLYNVKNMCIGISFDGELILLDITKQVDRGVNPGGPDDYKCKNILNSKMLLVYDEYSESHKSIPYIHGGFCFQLLSDYTTEAGLKNYFQIINIFERVVFEYLHQEDVLKSIFGYLNKQQEEYEEEMSKRIKEIAEGKKQFLEGKRMPIELRKYNYTDEEIAERLKRNFRFYLERFANFGTLINTYNLEKSVDKRDL